MSPMRNLFLVCAVALSAEVALAAATPERLQSTPNELAEPIDQASPATAEVIVAQESADRAVIELADGTTATVDAKLLSPDGTMVMRTADGTVVTREVESEPTPGEWSTFLTSIGNTKGLGAMGVSALVAQGSLLLLRTKMGDLTGKAKLSLVTGLTVLAGVTTLRMSGLDWPSSLMHSSTLAAGQVFAHQLFRTFGPTKVSTLA